MGERRGTKALELWCRRMTEGYPGVKIDNMTTSWRDGLAFCAMIHHFRPDLIEFEKLNKADVYYNNELAFTTAEKYLGIPALLDADDMAAYEVPDRLSILTYLSQFYQVFAAQDASKRLKRPSPAAEKTQNNKTPGPPPKMAHVVGVPRRDPCHKCQLPVFLAERLTVGKKVYHRTCLKCARCNSQLTPGSFYETEVDNEFCCETCPDEEEIEMDMEMDTDLAASSVPMRNSNDSKENRPANDLAFGRASGSTKGARSSIADRLAFFEQSKNGSGSSSEASNVAAGSKLLQRSVSDEEKTKSLQRMEAKPPAYKMNSALSNFLHDTVDGEDVEEEEDEADDGESEPTSSSDIRPMTHPSTSSGANDNDATEDEMSLECSAPPPVPATEIPQAIEEDLLITKTRTPTPAKRFTATAQLQLKKPTEPQAMGEHENISGASASATSSPTETVELETQESTIKNNNNNNYNNKEQDKDNEKRSSESVGTTRTVKSSITMNLNRTNASDELDAHNVAQQNIATNLELSEPNDNDCITKDKTVDAPEESLITTTTTITKIKETPSQDDEMKSEAKDKEEHHQLKCENSTGQENVATDNVPATSDVELRKKPSPSSTSSSSNYVEDAETTERLSVVRARLQQFEVIANNNNLNNNNNNNNNNSNNNNIDNENDISMNVKPETSSSNNLIENDEIVMIREGNETAGAKIETTKVSDAEIVEAEHVASSSETDIKSMDIESVDGTEETAKTDEINEIEKTENPQMESLNEVPLNDIETVESKPVTVADDADIEMKVVNDEEPSKPVDQKLQQQQQQVKEQEVDEAKSTEVSPKKPLTTKVVVDEYPEDLNPFKSDDEEEDVEIKANKENIPQQRNENVTPSKPVANLNPFDSSDDEIELEKSRNSLTPKVPPPRPPPPRISRNPFGDETDEDANLSRNSSLTSSLTRKTPVPTPRMNLSQNPTPEPTPRLSTKTPQSAQSAQQILQNSGDYYGSVNSLTTPPSWQRNSDLRGSNNSLTSSGGGTIRSRKNRKAPAPPPPPVKELFPSTETVDSSMNSTPSSSTRGSPRSGRKKRPAPAPPKPARLDPNVMTGHELNGTASKNLHSYPLQSELDSKLSDEEKALLEGKLLNEANSIESEIARRSNRRLIPLDASLLNDPDDTSKCDDFKQKQQSHALNEGGDSQVVYRRMLIPPPLDTPTHDRNPLLDSIAHHDRQLEKLKDNKEAKNRNRQSQISASSGAEDSDPMIYNKSAHGKWKRRKGPAPALPIPPRKVLQMLPLQEIRHELDIIEVQQQGLEKQGVILEKMIRDRCEGENGELINSEETTETDGKTDGVDTTKNSKEVEDLILQLFELVNEKNELFRRQAELMYLRRMHRLEQEQADLEYEIRVLMAQPERNKTDTDKAREEALIARMVEVVQLRNEVVECLEMDRLREAEEDLSIKQRLEMHTSKRDESERDSPKVTPKLSKKEKKKQKEAKKLGKSKKMDADKDADESELAIEKPKNKKKKRKFIF